MSSLVSFSCSGIYQSITSIIVSLSGIAQLKYSRHIAVAQSSIQSFFIFFCLCISILAYIASLKLLFSSFFVINNPSDLNCSYALSIQSSSCNTQLSSLSIYRWGNLLWGYFYQLLNNMIDY